VRGIPNARLWEANERRRWLAGDDDSNLQTWQPPPPDARAWEPEALYALETELSCRVRLSWAAGSPDGSFDALVTTGDLPLPRFPLGPATVPGSWAELASDPLAGKRNRELVTQLRRELREALPQHLIPSAIVVLPALPLNINGKLDLRSLPPPDLQRDPDAELVAPQTDAERKLVEVWCGLLGLDRIGIHDDFFELGGDSLLAVQVMARLPALFGVELKVRTLLERPTIHEVAKQVDVARAALRLTLDRPNLRPGVRDSGRI
jgi:acyl carrier protein